MEPLILKHCIKTVISQRPPDSVCVFGASTAACSTVDWVECYIPFSVFISLVDICTVLTSGFLPDTY